MDSLTVKTIAVFAIIFGCFAVLYPKIFHPIITNMFGATPAHNVDDDMFRSARPGSLHKAGKGGKHRNGPGDDFPPHMRGGPHPGMRAAAEMKKQMAPPGGNSGRGMMGIVLPMYAVGIVIYLIYTLTKVFGGGGKKKGDDDYLTSHFKEEKKKKKRHCSDEDVDQASQYRKVKQSQKDLEKLLIKADKDDLSECDMRDLRHRLLETERQMTRILQAMQDVHEKVADLSSGLSDSDDSEGSVSEQMQKLERLVQKRRHPKTTVDAKQEQKPTAAEDAPGSSPEHTEKMADSRPEHTEKMADSRPEHTEKMADSRPEHTEKMADSRPEHTEKMADSRPEHTEKMADSRRGEVDKVVDCSDDVRGGEKEKMADSSPDSTRGKQHSEKCSVPDVTPVTETIGPMEASDDVSCEDVAARCSRLMTDAGEGCSDIDLGVTEGVAGTEEMIPGCGWEAGESGDHSELRKRASAVTGDDRN